MKADSTIRYDLRRSRSATTGEFRAIPEVSRIGEEIEFTPISPRRTDAGRDIETAVYNQVRAMRALGKTEVSTADVAKALGISTALVRRAAAKLKSKGVVYKR
jgi:DNA invertase Pin-like site-specific DNA recombinase